ncbi:MAG: LicD family protein [Prevotella sp.]|nr:LicD family protein [Prevotella sp.]
MATYNIRQLQLKILENLILLHQVCEKHNLRYYLWAGSMLGAVRHGGFIPWDDDLDIAMPRRDYDLLVSHAKEWLPEPLEMVSFETDPERYPLPFAKLQDASTTLVERQHLRYVGGIYIDVFPLDGMPKSRVCQRIHFIYYQWLKKALYFVHRDPFKHGHGVSSWLPLLCRKLYTMQGLQEKIRQLQKEYDYDECSLVVDHDDGLKGVIEKSSLGNPTPVLFENATVWGVEKADEYLKQKYGDYMIIPNVEHQRQHNFHLLDLEKSYKDV